MSQLAKKIFSLASGTGVSALDYFRGFVTLSSCSVSLGLREAEYMEEVKRWKPEQVAGFTEIFSFLVDEMSSHEYEDLLGPAYMELGNNKTGNGEFYTPQHLSEVIARMTIPKELPEKGFLELLEPASGSGGMVLSAAKVLRDYGHPRNSIRATCIDVSRVACEMCYLNLTLWGIAAEVIHGNSLSNETWARWRNFFYYTPPNASRLASEEAVIIKENGLEPVAGQFVLEV